MHKAPVITYYYAYVADDGLLLSIPTIPTSRTIEQARVLYSTYENTIPYSMKDKKHILIKTTTTFDIVD